MADYLRRMFLSYSKAIHKERKSHGSLFQKPFRRIAVSDKEYLLYLVWYIHRNGLHHGLVYNLKDHVWSSFPVLTSDEPTWLKKRELMSWFVHRNEFIDLHYKAEAEWKELKRREGEAADY